MSRYWSSVVHKLTPYVPGEQPKVSSLIKLNTNENPYGPSPKVIKALKAGAGDNLRLYPDPNSDVVKRAVAKCCSIKVNQIFVGNGSDEVLGHIFQGLLKHDKPVLFPDITYSFYPVYCGLYEVPYELVPLTKDFSIDLKDYQRPNSGIIFPNPNAPTGIATELDDIAQLLRKNTDSVVVVDEAYVDFGAESAVSLIDDYPNLLVTQTISKSRSLAGLRVGYAMGNAELIEGLERVKNSFNSYPLDRLALVGAEVALADSEYFEKTRKAIIDSREKLIMHLQNLRFEVLPSSANFVFVRHSEQDAAELADKLREHSIIVRYFNKPRINQFLRITIGTPEECEALIAVLKNILN
tara:strand:+ start:1431 stop:2489 length:1059 start_codon:yes stop_codon:yes gene_type:complete